MKKVLRIINRFNLGGPTYNAAYLTKYLSSDYETLLVGGQHDETEASSSHILEDLNLNPIMLSVKNGLLSPKAFYRNFIIRKPWIDPHHCYEIGINGITVKKF